MRGDGALTAVTKAALEIGAVLGGAPACSPRGSPRAEMSQRGSG